MSILGAVMVPHPPIILPEIGRGEEKKIRATTDAYQKAMAFAASLKPETVIITSPHSVMYSDYFHISLGLDAEGDFRRFRAWAGLLIQRRGNGFFITPFFPQFFMHSQ